MSGPSIFLTATSALQSAQQGMALTSQNVAGQAVDGYTRRTMDASVAATGPNGAPPLGTGFAVEGFSRSWNQLLLQQRVQQSGTAALHGGVVDGMAALDTAVVDPATALDMPVAGFMRQLSAVARDPGDASALDALLTAGQALLGSAGRIGEGVAAVRANALAATPALLDAANGAADELATINRAIAVSQQGGGADAAAPELLDRRDLLLLRLGNLLGSQVGLAADGQAQVFVDGQPLVNGDRAARLQLQVADAAAGGAVLLRMRFAEPGASAAVTADIRPEQVGGRVGGQLVLTGVPATIAEADGLAPLLALFAAAKGEGAEAAANAPGASAMTRALAMLGAHLSGHASRDQARGALAALARQANQTGPEGAGAQQQTLLDSWRRFTGTVGTLVAAQASAHGAASTVEARLEAEAQSSGGVNLDEEAAQLLRYQQLYSAASRVLQANARLLDDLIAVING